MTRKTLDGEGDESINPLPEFDHDPDCTVCGGSGWHDDVPCYAGVELPTEPEAST